MHSFFQSHQNKEIMDATVFEINFRTINDLDKTKLLITLLSEFYLKWLINIITISNKLQFCKIVLSTDLNNKS